MYNGPKHLSSDAKQLFQYLQREVNSLREYNSFENLYDPVGPKFVRINLRPFMHYQLDLNWLFNVFLKSQNELPLGNVNFNEVKTFLENKGFLSDDISSALIEYQEKTVSHSPQYHQFYKPSYRLISRAFLTTEIQILQIKNFLNQYPKPFRFIAIDGKAASGKTTLVSQLSKSLPSTVINADDFFDNSNNKIGINSMRIRTELLDKAHTGQNLNYRIYNCSTETFQEKTVPLVLPLLIEGAYSANKDLRSYFDLVFFMDIDSLEQRKRLEERSKSLLEKFTNQWIPRENNYIEREKIIQKADLII
jgi:uridine kinase